MINKELRLHIQEIADSGIDEDLTALCEWLRPGKKKDALIDAIDLIALQEELILNLTRDLADLRKEETPTENKFYPMSTNAKRRY